MVYIPEKLFFPFPPNQLSAKKKTATHRDRPQNARPGKAINRPGQK
jgi:hypothetical protein